MIGYEETPSVVRGTTRCRHAIDGGDFPGAVALLKDLAKPLCDRGEAHTFVGLVERIPPHLRADDIELALRTGEAWTELAQWQRAALCYERAHRLAERAGRADERARVLTAQGVLSWYRGDIPGAGRLLEAARRLLADTDEEHRDWDELREGLALVHSGQGRLDEAEGLLRRQLRVFQRRADAEGQRHVLANTALLVALRRGDFDNAGALLREAVDIARQHGLRLGLARTHNCLAFVLNWSGQHAEALDHAQWALRHSGSPPVSHIVGFAQYNRAVALLHQGDTEAAHDACLRSLRELDSGCSSLLGADVLMAQAQAESSRSLLSAARTARSAVDVARMQQDLWTLAVHLVAYAGLADPAAARAALEEAGTLLERYGDPHQLLRWRLAAASLAHTEGDRAALGEHVGHLLTQMCHYPGLTASITERLGVLLPAAIEHGSAPLPLPGPLGTAWAQAFAPLAADLLASPDERVREWAVRALGRQREAWAYELLAGHRDPTARIRGMAAEAISDAGHQPLPEIGLRCLGGSEVRLSGVLVLPERWGSLHAQLILFRLAHTGGATRDELIELLWPDEDPARTEARLRTTIRILRSALRPAWHPRADYITHRAGRYGLSSGVQVTSDVQRFEHWIDHARRQEGAPRWQSCEQAVACYRGPFLPDWRQEWAHRERERLTGRWLWALEEHGSALLAADRAEEAEERARQVIAVDELRERAWRVLLHALDRQGRRAEAVRSYRQLQELLHDLLGTAPAPATRRLAGRLTG
ncbi:BTAD domain-containing putative transcriptional regulator [Streptomyces pini]|uniref:DNA-binding transcriptional activator of the SARP family n=1 Tax=Streptomyces pini TaxID=1520580 RepID=A0A1I4B2Q7_9ACTN|nr:BTAD domain-containing putative transcriptional regulator [Streptomyces pini]SFK63172.1 DNA-binding transcriptional activator of the SARP family [Streptomyces pini]